MTDQVGSIVALTDSRGEVKERIRYEAFGESVGSSFSRYGYTGRERDQLTGLIYYRNRWLDPQQGRFLTEDPIQDSQESNLYLYVKNNPLSLIDPEGLQDKKPDPNHFVPGLGFVDNIACSECVKAQRQICENKLARDQVLIAMTIAFGLVGCIVGFGAGGVWPVLGCFIVVAVIVYILCKAAQEDFDKCTRSIWERCKYECRQKAD